MNIDPTAGAASAAPMSPTQAAMGELSPTMFLELFVAQVRHQDPLEPMDSSQMLAQTAQLSELQTFETLRASQETLLIWQQFSVATNLHGKTVSWTTTEGERSGVVDEVRMSENAIKVTVDGEEIAMSDVVAVSN